MKMKKIFLLSWRRFMIALLIFILSVFLHNIISVLFGIEEAIFFTIATALIPLYLTISIIYTLVKTGIK